MSTVALGQAQWLSLIGADNKEMFFLLETCPIHPFFSGHWITIFSFQHSSFLQVNRVRLVDLFFTRHSITISKLPTLIISTSQDWRGSCHGIWCCKIVPKPISALSNMDYVTQHIISAPWIEMLFKFSWGQTTTELQRFLLCEPFQCHPSLPHRYLWLMFHTK